MSNPDPDTPMSGPITTISTTDKLRPPLPVPIMRQLAGYIRWESCGNSRGRTTVLGWTLGRRREAVFLVVEPSGLEYYTSSVAAGAILAAATGRPDVSHRVPLLRVTLARENRCPGRRRGLLCVQSRGHEGPCAFRCLPWCPGYPWAPAEAPHPCTDLEGCRQHALEACALHVEHLAPAQEGQVEDIAAAYRIPADLVRKISELVAASPREPQTAARIAVRLWQPEGMPAPPVDRQPRGPGSFPVGSPP